MRWQFWRSHVRAPGPGAHVEPVALLPLVEAAKKLHREVYAPADIMAQAYPLIRRYKRAAQFLAARMSLEKRYFDFLDIRDAVDTLKLQGIPDDQIQTALGGVAIPTDDDIKNAREAIAQMTAKIMVEEVLINSKEDEAFGRYKTQFDWAKQPPP